MNSVQLAVTPEEVHPFHIIQLEVQTSVRLVGMLVAVRLFRITKSVAMSFALRAAMKEAALPFHTI